MHGIRCCQWSSLYPITSVFTWQTSDYCQECTSHFPPPNSYVTQVSVVLTPVAGVNHEWSEPISEWAFDQVLPSIVRGLFVFKLLKRSPCY